MNPLKAKYQSLAPRAEVLFDTVILAQAWKKAGERLFSGEDLAQLRPLDKKTDRTSRFVTARSQGVAQFQQVQLLPCLEAQRIDSVALVAAAGDVLPVDVGK